MVSCTSTGGITGKMAGRVGDTPIPGAGGYCDNRVGTISTTGHGDSIMRYCLAQKIIQMLENGIVQLMLLFCVVKNQLII